ncbi:GNAT family N-acetyltransferase [Tabrizicola sp. TH137]|uniref:GNAT family N-acetyltransferase n=1 Tax=Tabrizicola sp. TH137 TaxID=2067452 RepID=UPI000C7D4D26|nr:GNAT family N-acetyltransferase [Tabrizicola sp. TH137]PLL14084.1 GNAT family N-acetyltransferase [Tabrizicola sp. TH137]
MIRALQPQADHAAVADFLDEAADYWHLADGAAPGPQAAADFFTDCPPGCDPAASHRLGLFHEGRLSGLAELSFGFPEPGDAYLGLMILAPRLRGQGLGAGFLAHVETLARAANAPTLYLGVIEANPRGRAFWERHGFRPTGITQQDDRNLTHRLAKPL